MSDHRKPNQYEPLKDTAREVDAKKLAEEQKLAEAAQEERRSERYEAIQLEKREKNLIDQAEYRHRLYHFENNPSFRKDALSDMAKLEESERAKAAEAEAPKAEATGKSSEEVTETRAMRMQRLKEYTEQAARDQEGQENDGPTHDGGRGR